MLIQRPKIIQTNTKVDHNVISKKEKFIGFFCEICGECWTNQLSNLGGRLATSNSNSQANEYLFSPRWIVMYSEWIDGGIVSMANNPNR